MKQLEFIPFHFHNRKGVVTYHVSCEKVEKWFHDSITEDPAVCGYTLSYQDNWFDFGQQCYDMSRALIKDFEPKPHEWYKASYVERQSLTFII